MITNDDLNTLSLSPTNKDYYQIWSELIETAGKISERWDPSSTNESDPGIVLLKVLTAIADKLNYNIDKNILEAFMPTAAQEESMKRLCDMMGYHIGYYESATTDVTIRYLGNVADLSEENKERLPDGNNEQGITGLLIPAFTAISNEDKTIYYLTTRDVLLTNEETIVTAPCIEGQRIICEVGNSNVITMANLDENYRFYLPEPQIAENGIFVYGTVAGKKTTTWQKVNNLNVTPNNTKAYSFGLDSSENRPYLQFPTDVNFLLEDGLEIHYIRTSGAAGNISARTLTTLEKPTFGMWKDFASNEKFSVTNPKAALNGKNPETIDQAYNGFKKTIGTFDTLVTCRDYMNKIYQLIDDQNIELVSNVVVSDIRDDINRAHVLCSFGDYGITYIERGNTTYSNEIIRSEEREQPIDHFDLILYPFKTYQRLNTKNDFDSSFQYTDAKIPEIKAQLENYKTIAHSYKQPIGSEIVCIKNYLQLNAKISTIHKVNQAEEALILANIKIALYQAFNMRELDFGEEIPYESILKVIENADDKIKFVLLDEPVLVTKFLTADGREYEVGSSGDNLTGEALYNKLALRNILAGRAEVFKYDSSFKVELGESLYPAGGYETIYPTPANEAAGESIEYIKTECIKTLPTSDKEVLTLKPNEVVKFRAPNFKTVAPYSSYVNYFLRLRNGVAVPGVAANFISINDLWDLPINVNNEEDPYKSFGVSFINYAINTEKLKLEAKDFDTEKNTQTSSFGTLVYYFEDVKYLGAEVIQAKIDSDDKILEAKTTFLKAIDKDIGSDSAIAINTAFNAAYTGLYLLEYIPTPEVYNAKLALHNDAKKTYSDTYDTRVAEIQNDCKERNDLYNNLKNSAAVQCLYYNSKTYTDKEGIWDDENTVEKLLGEVYPTKITKDGGMGAFAICEGPTEGVFPAGFYFVVDLKNEDAVFSTLLDWAQLFGYDYKLDNGMACPSPLELPGLLNDEEKVAFAEALAKGKAITELLKGAKYSLERGVPYSLTDGTNVIFKTLGTNAERKPGKHVNNKREKFIKCDALDASQSDKAWNVYFWPVPQTFTGIGAKGEYHQLYSTGTPWRPLGVSKPEPSTGRDSIATTIATNTDYELREGEALYINYTPSSAVAKTEGATNVENPPLNLYYGPGTIIRPSGTLVLEDSLTRYNTGKHSWTKTTGFDFSAFERGQTIEGMYNVGPNEQLDIRDFIEVNLNETANLYWILNDTIKLGNKTDIEANKNDISILESYTLEDGEYFFYSDKHKLDMAYYGAGTEIRFTGHGQRVFKFAKDITQVNIEEILEKGISAIPWRTVTLDANNSITFREFQYVTLTAGDSIRGLTILPQDPNAPQQLTNTWQKVDSASPCYYAFAGTSPINDGIALPIINLQDENAQWEVRSFFELDFGPDKAQTLSEDNVVTLLTADKQVIETIRAIDNVPVSIKANYPWQSSADLVKVKPYDDDALKIKVFQDTPVSIVTKESFKEDSPEITTTLPLYNFNSIWTSFGTEDFYDLTIDSADTAYSFIRMPVTVPKDHYNIMLVYYLASEGTKDLNQGLGFQFCPLSTGTDGKAIYTPSNLDDGYVKIFNNISVSDLNNFIDRPGDTDEVIDFDEYFNKLAWWTQGDLGHTAENVKDSPAFGKKSIINLAQIKNKLNMGSDDAEQGAYAELENVYFLRPGVNIIAFTTSGRFDFYPDTDLSGSIRVSDVDSIYALSADLGTNVKVLDYHYTGTVKALDEDLSGGTNTSSSRPLNKAALTLLRDIRAKDPNNEFYYNCPLQAATAIDINTALDNHETLSMPKFWYDPNNINNKFVISQIDTDYLDDGITIARASKF